MKTGKTRETSFAAADTITPEQVDFMLRIGRGTMCVPMPSEEAERLRIRPVVDGSQNTAPQQTAFLMAVDHVNAGTGVSAENRATTIRGLADPASTPADFVVPGHNGHLWKLWTEVFLRPCRPHRSISRSDAAFRASSGGSPH